MNKKNPPQKTQKDKKHKERKQKFPLCFLPFCVFCGEFFPLILILAFLTLLPATFLAQTRKSDYLGYIKQAAETGWNEYPQVLARWKQSTQPSELWGYDAPGQPVYLADLLAFLSIETGDKTYAERARDILVSFGDLREVYPKEYQAKRAEYRDGIPAISNFFIMPAYARAYLRLQKSGVLDARSREKIERDLAFSLDHIFYFPEWGAHNRAMLRAESLYYGALAVAHHPRAPTWRQLAVTLASDSLSQWEIEDASGYSAIWLYSLFSYAEASGNAEVIESPLVKYALDYFLNLLAPHGSIADFGDANRHSGWDRFIPVYEKAATIYRNRRYKYAAQELLACAIERYSRSSGTAWAGVGTGSAFTDAYRWADDSIVPQKPVSGSQEVLDDIVGKKVVFRNGWERSSTFLLLNYRDEGEGGRVQRDYLRQTLSVEEEKAHHGHADENSIALLMTGGSVLLHDGGYRDSFPSGAWGSYRADYFHNRVVARKNKRAAGQNVFEFMRNSGAYRRVETQKVDFLKFKEVDASRTRVVDDDLGYQWDRIITYVKGQDLFIVVDGIKALKSDFFTFTNLWHTRKILHEGPQYFDTIVDRIGNETLPDNRSLMIYFPENHAKQIGTYAERRHFQDETAIYQTISSHYQPGDIELFVTVLVPHALGEDAAKRLDQFRLLKVDKFPAAVGLEIGAGNEKSALGIKLDLEMDLARGDLRPRYVYDLGKVQYGDFETDASYLFATMTDRQIHYSAATMTKIRYKGKTIMAALPNTFGLQLDGAPPRTGYAKWRFWEDVIKFD
jgi:hypothetical protein